MKNFFRKKFIFFLKFCIFIKFFYIFANSSTYINVKKIIITTVLSILLLIGGIVFLIKNQATKVVSQYERDYLIVTPLGQVDYKFPLPFEKGTEVDLIASYFAKEFRHILHFENRKWVEMNWKEKIYADIKIKITK